MDFKDYYSTLGVAKTATEKEIKQAFRKLARKHHPDVNPGDKAAEARFKEINEAYEVLGDPGQTKEIRRARRQLADVRTGRRSRRRRRPARRLERRLRRPARGGGYPHDDRRGNARDVRRRQSVLRFLPYVLRRRGRRRRGRPAGLAAAGAPGRTRRAATSSRRSSWSSRTPTTARRGGFAIKHDGQARTVDVRIPAGVGDGSRVRVAGEGEHGTGGAQSGDLYLRIRLAPHPRFERKGRDLYTRVPVPLTTAVLGGEAEVQTLGGQAAAAQDSADDAERAGVPAEGSRHAGRRQAG